MKEYKLINNQTKEEHFCDKITIDGFYYYVSDECNDLGGWHIDTEFNFFSNPSRYNVVDSMKAVIACNNPNVDIPHVVDEVEKLAKEHCEYWKFDRLLGSGSNGLAHDSFVFGYSKSQETNRFSEEDMIEFAWWLKENIGQFSCDRIAHFNREYLKLWKEQQIKTIYYS